MSDTAIKVEGLSKRYRIGQYVGGAYQYRALRDVLTDAMHAPFRRLRARIKQRAVASNPTSDIKQPVNPSANFIWALRDVSFEVKQGEVVGIIGRNGAGKTTLLKLLSRITEPTEGRAEIKGRLGSLLEVGTGFHPELTGRENIYLSGAVLGMTKKEIDGKFDEIVAFAEVEKFIDTPVKRYSSGMWVRLGFAVAAHLEPEILLVDEVLAVGDAAFQKKCLGKMKGVAKKGRTVVFVSHNMVAMRRLCERVILLEEGRKVDDGFADHVIARYLALRIEILAERIWQNVREAPGNDTVRLRAVRVRDEEGKVVKEIDIRRPVGIEVEYWNLHPVARPTVALGLLNEQGTCLFSSFDFNSPDWKEKSYLPEPGLVKSICWIPGNFLAEGTHYVKLNIVNISPVALDHVDEREVVSFEIIDTGEGDSVRGDYTLMVAGVVRPMLQWDVSFIPTQTDKYTND